MSPTVQLGLAIQTISRRVSLGLDLVSGLHTDIDRLTEMTRASKFKRNRSSSSPARPPGKDQSRPQAKRMKAAKEEDEEDSGEESEGQSTKASALRKLLASSASVRKELNQGLKGKSRERSGGEKGKGKAVFEKAKVRLPHFYLGYICQSPMNRLRGKGSTISVVSWFSPLPSQWVISISSLSPVTLHTNSSPKDHIFSGEPSPNKKTDFEFNRSRVGELSNSDLAFTKSLKGEKLVINRSWSPRQCQDFLEQVIPPALFSHIRSRMAANKLSLKQWIPFYLLKRNNLVWQVQVPENGPHAWDGMEAVNAITKSGSSGRNLFMSMYGPVTLADERLIGLQSLQSVSIHNIMARYLANFCHILGKPRDLKMEMRIVFSPEMKMLAPMLVRIPDLMPKPQHLARERERERVRVLHSGSHRFDIESHPARAPTPTPPATSDDCGMESGADSEASYSISAAPEFASSSKPSTGRRSARLAAAPRPKEVIVVSSDDNEPEAAPPQPAGEPVVGPAPQNFDFNDFDFDNDWPEIEQPPQPPSIFTKLNQTFGEGGYNPF
jgi:hypothetical protein